MSKKMFHVAVIFFFVVVFSGVLVADDGPEHQVAQLRPIKLGTSGGNINDRSTLYCCSGTLGALVEGDGVQYILSNNHVLARSNLAEPGEGINQPGQIDQNCGQEGIVAHLSDFVVIRFKRGRVAPLNKVDAAIGLVVDGTVDANGAILDIGEVSSETVEAMPGQAVKKSGRTTGFTQGIVTDIGVTVDVGYSKECGGPANQIARFTNQIFIAGTGGAFSAGGDSGSLIVEDAAASPRAVGLLFAGSSTHTVANPIGAVLSAFSVTMPGGTAPQPQPTETGTISGTVTSKVTGAAVEGAEISTDTGQATTTDAGGSYTVSDVPVGVRQLAVSASGFRSLSATVTVAANTTVNADFALKVSRDARIKGKGVSRGAINRALRVKKLHEKKLLDIEGVVGAGVGVSAKGQAVIKVYLEKDSDKVKAKIPAALNDVPVEAVVTGAFEAF